MTGGLGLGIAAGAAYLLSYFTLWGCCDRESERDRQISRRWAIFWLTAFMFLAVGAGAMIVVDNREAIDKLDSTVHAH